LQKLALGKKLDSKQPVHHFYRDRKNLKNFELVICENQKYHRLLHRRESEILGRCGKIDRKVKEIKITLSDKIHMTLKLNACKKGMFLKDYIVEILKREALFRPVESKKNEKLIKPIRKN